MNKSLLYFIIVTCSRIGTFFCFLVYNTHVSQLFCYRIIATSFLTPVTMCYTKFNTIKITNRLKRVKSIRSNEAEEKRTIQSISVEW